MNQYEPSFLKTLLEKMLLIRFFEEKAAQMYGLRKICGFLHLYIGQEAVAVGSIAALDLSRDYVVAAYRDHGHALACGMDPKAAMAELFGKATGCSKGKGGSMHFFDSEHHMLGGNGIVGSQIPVATGVALKIRNMKEDGVVLCFFGDGAIHQGAFHESLNMARIWNLPIIYICENNQYGMGTFYKRVSAVTEFSKMTVAYDIPGKTIDGMDVLTVYEEMKAAVENVRKERIPMFFEIKTYRYKGHSMSDPAKYRTKEEVEEYRKLDPIERLKSKMLEWNVLTQEAFEQIQKSVIAQVEEAVQFAEKSPEPPLEELYKDVLVEER
ncbi:MAG: pyruvate dehydrogenase component alpha subunit [Thermotogota bacterium]|nr:pyruvate dehydrogenase component alpha subunit [Thermotogota bacterium]